MWRTYVICVLTGLLLVSTGSSILIMREVVSVQADADRMRQRMVAAEGAQANLQQQIDQLKAAQASGAPQPQPTPSVAAVPVPTVAAPASAQSTLQQIEDEVAGIRGLLPRNQVPLQFLDRQALQRYFVDRFNADYLPIERESDQKLLTTLGLLNPSDSIVQILLDVLQEQVIGVYNDDDKAMYIVADSNQFGAEEKATFAHEFTHALQDQYYDLRALAPKHPDNDDRSLALQALIEGDAVLSQRLWTQLRLSQDEIGQLGQGGADSTLFAAPLFVREQLLFPYGDGFNFVRQIYQSSGGYAAVDNVFQNPPDSTEQILHPEKYRSREKPVDVRLPDVAAALGEGWRTIRSNILGELDLRLILEQLTDRTRAVRGSSGWGGDRWVLLEKDGQQALVIKSVWDTELDARNHFDAFAAALRNRFGGAKEEEASTTRQALTAANAATEVRRGGVNVLVVISFDRPSADAIVAALAPADSTHSPQPPLPGQGEGVGGEGRWPALAADFERQTIVGHLDVRADATVGCLVLQGVANVGQIRASRLQLGDQVERLGHAQVSRVRFPTEGVDHHDVQIAQQRPGGGRHAAGIRQIGEVANAVAGRPNRAMAHRDRLNAAPGSVERGVVDGGVADMWDEADPGRTRECVGKPLAERCARRRVPEAGQHAAQRGVEGLQVVDARGVIGVKVGVEHRVDSRDVLAQCLQPELGTRVDDQPRSLVGFDVHRSAGALVAWIAAGAGWAAAADDGHTVRG
jgi:hypothetical protein